MVLSQDWALQLNLTDPEARQTVGPVSWPQYDRWLAEVGDHPGYRVTFLDGLLEVMSPSRRHEVSAENIGRLLEAYFEETRTRFWGLGSTTFRQAQYQSGTEPDKSYCLHQEREFPDLAIEVVVTSGGVDKLEIYRRLRVPEVWFFRDDQFQVYGLKESSYELLTASRLLPDLDLDTLAEFALSAEPLEALIGFRQYLHQA